LHVSAFHPKSISFIVEISKSISFEGTCSKWALNLLLLLTGCKYSKRTFYSSGGVFIDKASDFLMFSSTGDSWFSEIDY